MTVHAHTYTLSCSTSPFSLANSSEYVDFGTQLADVRGVVSSSIRSICSSVRPLVSGIKK